MPGTLMLTDCLEACQANESCGAVNYETGLCVLFSSNSDKLPGIIRDFIVFEIDYLKKSTTKRSIISHSCIRHIKLIHNNINEWICETNQMWKPTFQK